MKWYYVDGKDRLGPFEDDDFRKLIDEGTITDETLIWNQSMESWQPLESVSALKQSDAVDAPPVVAPSPGTTEPLYSCSECGNDFPKDELIQFENARVCGNCKPVFVQKIREGVSVSGVIYAGFWIRFGAKFIDWLALMVVNSLMGLVFGGLTMSSAADPSTVMASTFILSGLQMCVAAAYSCFFLGRFAATPGKLALGLTVITGSHDKVSYLQGFGRYFGELLSGIILCIGYFMVAFDDEKRGLHDRVCNTRVVYKNSIHS